MAGIAFDNLVDTGVLVQALPVWESEWAHPDRYDHSDLLKRIAAEGRVIGELALLNERLAEESG